jgi:hypothetical protein
MADKEQLDKMLDSMINDKGEQAEIHFHDYLQGKMQEVIHGEVQTDEPEPEQINTNEE